MNTVLFNDKAKAALAARGDLFDFPNLRISHNHEESAAIHETKGPKIILAGSGMSVGGRVVSHEKYYLGDPVSAVVFVGYQAPGSLGRRIADGEKTSKLTDNGLASKRASCPLTAFRRTRTAIIYLEFVSHSQKTLKKVFVCMGEPKSETFLAQKIRDNLNIDAVCPEEGSSAELI